MKTFNLSFGYISIGIFILFSYSNSYSQEKPNGGSEFPNAISVPFLQDSVVHDINTKERFLLSGQSQWQNIPVNQNSGHQNETTIAINPSNPLNMVGGWIDLQSGINIGYGYSNDGGQNWSTPQLISEPTFPNQADPAIAVDRNGNFYYSFISYVGWGGPNGLFVTKSTNGGATWLNNVPVIQHINYGENFEDKPYIAVDATGGNYDGNVYVSWTTFFYPSGYNQIKFAYSTDSGQSFTILSEDVSDSPDLTGVQGSIPAVGPNGYVYVAWLQYGKFPDRYDNKIYIDKSTNGGVSFGSDIFVTDAVEIGEYIFGAGGLRWYLKGSIRINSLPTLVVDQSNGNIYIAWADQRNGDPDILFTRSTDGGQTWSNPIRVNDDPVGNGIDQFFPWMTVGPTGNISIVFYDSRNDPNNILTDLYMVESTDGGLSFNENQRISDTSFDPTILWNGYFFGDYIGVSSGSAYVYPLWADSRDGNQDIYTAKVKSNMLSSSPTATAYNNGRRIVRDSSGKYHLVYEDNGEIYYTYSTDNGSTWQTETVISDGSGYNKYPSIDVDSNNNYHIVWQKSWGSDIYDILYYKSGASSITNLGAAVLSPEPRPVISNSNPTDGEPTIFRAVVWQNGDGLSVRPYLENFGWGGEWTIPNTDGNCINPSMAFDYDHDGNVLIYTVHTVWQRSSYIYYEKLRLNFDEEEEEWFIQAYDFTDISSFGEGDPDEYDTHQDPSVSVSGDRKPEVVWDVHYTDDEEDVQVLLHRKKSSLWGTSWSSLKRFVGNDDYYFPSICSHDNFSNDVSIVWNKDIGQYAQVYLVRRTDGSWGSASNKGSGQYPSISTGSFNAKMVWTGGTTSPYTIISSSSGLPKQTYTPFTYHREEYLDLSDINFGGEGRGEVEGKLTLTIGEMELISNSGNSSLDFVSVPDSLSAKNYLISNPFFISSEDFSLKFWYRLKIRDFNRNTIANGLQNRHLAKLVLRDVSTNRVVKKIGSVLLGDVISIEEDNVTFQGVINVNLSPFQGRYVYLSAETARQIGIIPFLTEIFYYDEGLSKRYADGETAENKEGFIRNFVLFQNYPNPFNPKTEIRYTLPELSYVTIKVFDILGREIVTLVNEIQEEGYHTIYWNGTNRFGAPVASGLYIYQIQAGDFKAVHKMILSR